jgi:hypothetical protein
MSVHKKQTIMCDDQVHFSQFMLQSVVKRQPQIVLQRVEEMFPALGGSLVSVLCKTELFQPAP